VQTFLPYADFAQSAACLDMKRLGKQRVETLQILNVLSGKTTGGWVNHPAVRMWRGSEHYLIAYGVAICREWHLRGYRDTCLEKILATLPLFKAPTTWTVPWLRDPAFHASHRSNLLRKSPEHYTQFGWTDDPADPYVWPV
jgi:hypothetical protein